MKVSELFRTIFGFTFIFLIFCTPILYAYSLEYAPRYMVSIKYDEQERIVEQYSFCMGIACFGLSLLSLLIAIDIIGEDKK